MNNLRKGLILYIIVFLTLVQNIICLDLSDGTEKISESADSAATNAGNKVSEKLNEKNRSKDWWRKNKN